MKECAVGNGLARKYRHTSALVVDPLNGRMKQKGRRFRIGRGKRQDDKEQRILTNELEGGSNSACGNLNLE